MAETLNNQIFEGTVVSTLALVTFSSFLALFSVAYSLGLFSKKGKYPPGPKAHPFVGHTFQVPKLKTWLYFEKLGKEFGSC